MERHMLYDPGYNAYVRTHRFGSWRQGAARGNKD